MTGWVKREAIPAFVAKNYPEIWDGDGWQINRCAADGRFILLDAVMPVDVPASGVAGSFDTLTAAQDAADSEGRPDWSEWLDVGE